MSIAARVIAALVKSVLHSKSAARHNGVQNDGITTIARTCRS